MILRRIPGFAIVSIICTTGALVFITGCKSESSVIDDNSYVFVIPHISSFSVSPAAVNTDTLLPATKLLGDSVTVNVSAALVIALNTPPDSIASATATIYDPDGNLFKQVSFLPVNGVAADSVLDVNISFKILRKSVGAYNVKALIATQYGNSAGSAATIQITDSAFHPPVISNLVSSDSVTIPSNGKVFYDTLLLQATDPAGVANIDSVNTRVYNAAHVLIKSTSLQLSGQSSGNGMYSVAFPWDSTYTRQSWYEFLFYAVNKSHFSSDTLSAVIYTR